MTEISTLLIRVQRPSKEPEQNWKDKMEVSGHWNGMMRMRSSRLKKMASS